MACLNEAMGKGRKTLVLVIAKLRRKYTLKALLNYTKLAKSTYYDALKKLSNAAFTRHQNQHDPDGRPDSQCPGREDEQHPEERMALQ